MGKRSLDVCSPSKAKKSKTASSVPSVSEMGNFSAGGSVEKTKPRKNMLSMSVMKYCTKGSLYHSRFGNGDLLVVQMMCQDFPNPLFQFKKGIMGYGGQAGSEDCSIPPDWEAFEEQFQAEFVYVTKRTCDWDSIGLQVFRCGIYLGGNVKDFVMFLDDYFKFRLSFECAGLETLPALPELEIYVSPGVELEIDQVTDEMHCPFSVVHAQHSDMSVFHLPPPAIFPNRVVILSIEMVTTDEIHMVFSGNTKPFQADFVAKQIKLTSHLKEGEQYAEHYRVVKNFSIADSAEAGTYVKKIHEECLWKSPLVVRFLPSQIAHTLVTEMLKPLKEEANVHFDE